MQHHPVPALLWRAALAGATSRDRTAARCSPARTAPQRTTLGPAPTTRERGWNSAGSCARGPAAMPEDPCCHPSLPPSLPLPWVTLLCSSPSAPGRSHPLQPLPSPSSRASHNTEFLFTQGKSVIYFPACFTSISSWITACRINPAPST